MRFVEVRAAGKRSAVTITTPTSASSLDEGTDNEDALTSGYRRQQRQSTPNTPRATPFKPNRPRLHPPGPSPPQTEGKPTPTGHPPTTRPPVASAAARARANESAQPSGGRNALHMTGQTNLPTCADSNWPNGRVPSPKTSIPAPYHTNCGTPHPTDGSNVALHPQGGLPGAWTHPEGGTTQLGHDCPCRHGRQSCLAGPLRTRGLNLRNQDLSLTMNSASGNALPIIGEDKIRPLDTADGLF